MNLLNSSIPGCLIFCQLRLFLRYFSHAISASLAHSLTRVKLYVWPARYRSRISVFSLDITSEAGSSSNKEPNASRKLRPQLHSSLLAYLWKSFARIEVVGRLKIASRVSQACCLFFMYLESPILFQILRYCRLRMDKIDCSFYALLIVIRVLTDGRKRFRS